MMGLRRLEINATLTYISNHPPKLEIHTSFLGQEPWFLQGRRLMWGVMIGTQSVYRPAPALYAAVLTGGKLGMMEGGLKGGKADL